MDKKVIEYYYSITTQRQTIEGSKHNYKVKATMNETAYSRFLGKQCKLRFETDFTLSGTVIDATEHGVIFQTPEKSSFISWSRIKQLEIVGDD